MVDHRILTIQSLPNEVLLYVFSFHRLLSGTNDRPPAVAWRWHTLTHVCQRWRHLILGSLRHLGARLVIPRNSLKTPSDSWLALPLSIWYESEDYMSSKQMAEVVAAFEHSDRIREISLPVTMGHPFWKQRHNNESFLELEHLALSGFRQDFFPIVLPRDFFGGSTGPRRLRNILLSDLYLPALPQLLSSNRDLVSLYLGYYTLTCIGSISPEVLSNALSATTQLEYLYVDCVPVHTESYAELTSGNSSPLVVLPALTYFHFGGFIEYMENFVSRIHAPHLEKLDIYSSQSVLDIPQLSQFISRAEQLSSLPSRTSISLDVGDFSIKHHFNFPPSPKVSHVYLRCVDMQDWGVSQVHHICTQLSPLASSVKQLKISAFHLPPNLQRKTDPAPWLQLLTPYNCVEEVEFCGKGAPSTGIACALEQSTRETAQELLPALRVLRIRGFHTWSIRLITSFVAARQLTSRPVIIRRLAEKSEDIHWETFDARIDISNTEVYYPFI